MTTDENLSMTPDNDKDPQRRKRPRKGPIVGILLLLFLLAGIGAGAWWYLFLRFEESTDDAYVAGNVLRIIARITADDRRLEDTFMMLAVCNGQQYGGGYCAAPHASMTDGLLDVVLLRPVPRLKLPGLLGSYKKGEHLSEGDTVTEKFAPYMTFFRTGSIDIEVLYGIPLITTLDGECSPVLRMHAEIAHSAVRILLPPELAANANKTPVLQAMGE